MSKNLDKYLHKEMDKKAGVAHVNHRTKIVATVGPACDSYEDGSPNTAHTLNPVPLFLISREHKSPLQPGKLGDLAPTILHLMQLPVPVEMTGNVLTVGND